MAGSRKERVPSYCRHKASNRGYARFAGQQRPTYFPGPYGSAESRAAYDRELAAWLARGRRPALQAAGLTVAELTDGWLTEARRTYLDRDGRPSAEYRCQAAACRPLLALYADTAVLEFSPPMLRLVRSRMVSMGWAEGTIRRHLSRIKSLFAWAVDEGLIPPAVHGALVARRRRRSSADGAPARPTQPRRPADPRSVAAVVKAAHPTLSAMVALHRLIGCRPGDLVIMRPMDLEYFEDVCRYTPESHKGTHRGQELSYWLGPRAQAVLRPFLHGREPGEFVFRSPWARTAQRYTVARYARQLDAVLDRLAPLPRFTAHDLRRLHASEVRAAYGIEAAQVRLGHKHIRTAELYAQKSADLARRIARESG